MDHELCLSCGTILWPESDGVSPYCLACRHDVELEGFYVGDGSTDDQPFDDEYEGNPLAIPCGAMHYAVSQTPERESPMHDAALELVHQAALLLAGKVLALTAEEGYDPPPPDLAHLLDEWCVAMAYHQAFSEGDPPSP